MKKVIVLLSGGQDSATCLFWAKNNFPKEHYEIEALGFDYGQKHDTEILMAKQVASIAGVNYTLLDIKGLLRGSALVEHTDTNESHRADPSLPASFTAGRNLLFLTLASSYFFEQGVTELVTGVCQTDYSGYPDCRANFIVSAAETISLALDRQIQIHTPLMYLTKAETWKMAKDLDILEVIINNTMTDYNGSTFMNEWGMGVADNPATVLRAKGYYEAKQKGWI